MGKTISGKTYLKRYYKKLMTLYSTLYTQIETEETDIIPIQIAAKAAYYTVVSHRYANSSPHLNIIDIFVKDHKEKPFKDFEKELAFSILAESRLHDLEVAGIITVVKTPNAKDEITLTTKGQIECINKGIDLMNFSWVDI